MTDSKIINKPIDLDETTTRDNSQETISQECKSDSLNKSGQKVTDLANIEDNLELGVWGVVRKNFFSELWPFFKVFNLILFGFFLA
jgi:hypothetical protein